MMIIVTLNVYLRQLKRYTTSEKRDFAVHKLETYLKHFHISQRGFAKDLGMNPTHLGRLLRGEAVPGLDLAYKIEKMTGDKVSVYEFLPPKLRKEIDKHAEKHLKKFEAEEPLEEDW